MSTPSTPKGYVGLRITVSGTTAVNLANAVSAVDANAPTVARQFNLQSDLTNAAGAYLLIGDSLVSQTRYGDQLDVGQARLYPPSIAAPLYTAIYLLPVTGATVTVNVEVMTS